MFDACTSNIFISYVIWFLYCLKLGLKTNAEKQNLGTLQKDNTAMRIWLGKSRKASRGDWKSKVSNWQVNKAQNQKVNKSWINTPGYFLHFARELKLELSQIKLCLSVIYSSNSCRNRELKEWNKTNNLIAKVSLSLFEFQSFYRMYWNSKAAAESHQILEKEVYIYMHIHAYSPFFYIEKG